MELQQKKEVQEKSIWLEVDYLMMWTLYYIGTQAALMQQMQNHQILINLLSSNFQVYLLTPQDHPIKADLLSMA